MQFKPDEIEHLSSESKSESSYLLFQPKRDAGSQPGYSGTGASGWQSRFLLAAAALSGFWASTSARAKDQTERRADAAKD